MSDAFDPVAILQTLDERGVAYVVIGGFAAWLHGAPVVTTDIDIIYQASEPNIAQLCLALEDLQAIYRHQFGRRLEPTASGLASTQGAGHHLLTTRAGDLDALRSAAGHDYEDLVADVVRFDIDGVDTPVLALARIIELKAAANRPKDIAALPVLRAALEDDPETG